MRPVDPRLLRQSRPAQRWIGIAVIGGLVNAVLIIGMAALLSRVLAGAVAGHESWHAAVPLLVAVACIAAGRGVTMWVAEYAGHRGARRSIAALRGRLFNTLAAEGPDLLQGQRTGALVTAATTGVEALDTYFARYLPQLVLGMAVPVMALVFLAFNDLLSAIIVLVTLPLIPLFMILVGVAAQHRMESRWALMQRLSAYFLDVIQGLPTLRIFGRADAQVERVRAISEASRRATMSTLSIAFLSAMVLELLASIATALVAAEIGLRLVDGTMTLQTGLLVLILVPEAYMPLRQLGTYFHASMEGMTAAGTILDLTQGGADRNQREGVAVSLGHSPITFSEVTYTHGERGEGITTPLDCCISPRGTTLVVGRSGAGKTTLLELLVPFRRPTTGTIRVGGIDLEQVNPDSWRAQIGWVPQHPALFPGTVLDNLRLGAPAGTEGEVEELLERLFPDGSVRAESVVAADGEGISGGERMRLALARALLREPRLLILDEPTAFLDPESAARVVSLLREISGTTMLVIATHEPERFPWAGSIVNLDRESDMVSEQVG